MPNNFKDTKQMLKQAVIEANTLRKLQHWLINIQANNLPLDAETVLFYIDHTKNFYKERRKDGK